MTAYLKNEKQFLGNVKNPETYQCHPPKDTPGPTPKSQFMFLPDYMGQMVPGSNMTTI